MTRSAATAARAGGRPPRVALAGPYASHNLGDTAIQMAAIQNLRQRRPDLEIVGLSPSPDDTLASLGIPAFPLSAEGEASGALRGEPFGAASPAHTPLRRWAALRRADAFVQSLDLLVFSGGGQLDDFWGGAWGHPWAMLRWSLLARLHGVPVAVVGVGFDRLGTRLSRAFALSALRLASYRSFRDAGTREHMQHLGLGQPSVVCPDLAFGLAVGKPRPATDAAPFAVINPISRKTWSHDSDERHERYLQQLAEAGAWLASRGLSIRIVCSQPRMDRTDAAQLASMLASRDVGRVEVCEPAGVDDYLALVSGADVVVAARLHGALLALLAGGPVIALSPLPKVERLMADVGMEAYVLPLQTFDARALIDRLDDALARAPRLRARIAAVKASARSRLSDVFDEVIRLLGRDEAAVPAATKEAKDGYL